MFKGMGNLGNLASMMGSLQKLPEQLKQLNARMQQETVSATSGCSMVTVTMNGVGHVKSVKITDDGLRGEELERAVLDATNAAGAAAKQMYADGIHEMASDMNLNIPGLEGMLAHLTGSK